MQVEPIELKRDCEATRIPGGDKVVLPAGLLVDITQSLGGSYTVRGAHGLFRIAAADADALGLEKPAEAAKEQAAGARAELDAVWATLRNCYDPEIPLNIVDLGLVYDMQMNPLPSGNNRVDVKMTLTAPGCGMGPAIADEARQKLLDLPGIEEANVEIVWEPQWHHSMITPEGRKILGLD